MARKAKKTDESQALEALAAGIQSVDVTSKYHGIAGWGFGNHAGVDDAQGFGWRGVESGRTVFEISVKTSALSQEEETELKK